MILNKNGITIGSGAHIAIAAGGSIDINSTGKMNISSGGAMSITSESTLDINSTNFEVHSAAVNKNSNIFYVGATNGYIKLYNRAANTPSFELQVADIT